MIETVNRRAAPVRPARSFWQRWMQRPQTTWLRKAMFQIHLWTGILIGVYIVVVCVSGSAIVFRNDLYDIFEAWTKAGPTPWQSQIMRPSYIALRWLGEIHGKLLLGSDGMWWNAIGGFITAALCVTGMVIWWPGKAAWKRALGVRSGVGWKRFNFDLHSSIGFWTFLILFVWGMTGGYFVFPEPFRAAIDYFTPINPPRIAAAAQTGAQPVIQATPQTPQQNPSASKSNAGGPQAQASSGKPVQPNIFVPRRRRPLTLGGKILRGFSSAHYGNFGGWPVKLLYVILGFSPALLFGTALIMWWNRVLSPRIFRPLLRRIKRRFEASPAVSEFRAGDMSD